jgi:wyosine [tRNA(Phe)-imidazoG37] synthetase (radical SAM superfamily)
MIPLQQGILYGPIRSKRLGRSLGLNLFPADRKVCSFNCVYCHFGATTDHTRHAQGQRVPSVEMVLAAVAEFLTSDRETDYVTLSGNGEPTMYPHFAELVPRLRDLIRRERPAVKLALLSNSSTVADESLWPAFRLIDLPAFKLDAGDQATFEALNCPCPGLRIADIIDALARLARTQRLFIQTVMADGPVRNYEGEPFERWRSAIERIRPTGIQLYTTDRPVPDERVKMLSDEQLAAIARRVQELTGLEVRAY